VAVLTGGTAILAGWVTSHGNARAAKIQAEASALAQHRIQLRDTRRSAYLALIEQGHRIGELYWRLGDIDVQVTDPDQWAGWAVPSRGARFALFECGGARLPGQAAKGRPECREGEGGRSSDQPECLRCRMARLRRLIAEHGALGIPFPNNATAGWKIVDENGDPVNVHAIPNVKVQAVDTGQADVASQIADSLGDYAGDHDIDAIIRELRVRGGRSPERRLHPTSRVLANRAEAREGHLSCGTSPRHGSGTGPTGEASWQVDATALPVPYRYPDGAGQPSPELGPHPQGGGARSHALS
jgi:hypothetical protein